jgi:hypothetical protein
MSAAVCHDAIDDVKQQAGSGHGSVKVLVHDVDSCIKCSVIPRVYQTHVST